jgi:hypothetical protein
MYLKILKRQEVREDLANSVFNKGPVDNRRSRSRLLRIDNLSTATSVHLFGVGCG